MSVVTTSSKRPSLFRRIFISLALLAAVTSIAVLFSATSIYQSSVISDAGTMLESECSLVKSALSADADVVSQLSSLELGEIRVTYIDNTGQVLYDNENNATLMENHADRPEIAQALADGSGASERESQTEGKVVIYRALRLDNGCVLRLEVERESVSGALQKSIVMVAGVALLSVAVAWVLARIISERLMEPIMEINPAHPNETETYVELDPVINQISSQMDEIRNADLMRREFTSNVTHELKTPLSSISGAAELIRDNIARSEDVPEFASRIYDEAAHMTSLVNDILTLSKLDEAERSQDFDLLGQLEPVDLYQTALNVCKRLQPIAQDKDVSLSCLGSSVLVQGLPRLLDDLIFNLVDNAIRYNNEGGRVEITIGVKVNKAVLRVADTGAGIPEAAQAKVFERFYRVETSRARNTGGTGLGLAIVKHAAAIHNAEITLESKVNQGTTITVAIPLAS